MIHRVSLFLDILAWIGFVASLFMLGFIVYLERTYPGSKLEKRDKENGVVRGYYYGRYTIIFVVCTAWFVAQCF